MRGWLIFCVTVFSWFFLLLLPQTCLSSVRKIAKVNPGFRGSQMQYIDNNGLFLVSNSTNFGFGFNTNSDVTSFTVVIVHIASSRVVWSANRGVPIGNSDNFVFDVDGNAYIQTNGKVVWSTNTSQKGVSVMQLLDSGNLVLVGKDGFIIWQSFDHPTNTLMPNQEFKAGMKLVSDPRNNLTFSLEIKSSGDLILTAGYKNPQPYWAMGKDKRRIINKDGGNLESATVENNSWKFYDQARVMLGQFVFTDGSNANTTWAAVLEEDGFIRFYNLPGKIAGSINIPVDSCGTPQSCSSYLVCHDGNTCQCPSGLNAISCKPTPVSCSGSKDQKSLINAGEGLSYSALGFMQPSSKTSLEGCKSSCLNNCSCLVMFFDNRSGNCYMFNQIGSFMDAKNDVSFESYVMVSHTSHAKKKQSMVVVIVIVIVTVFVIITLVIIAVRLYNKKNNKDPVENVDETSEEDNFLESLSGMPIRFTYLDLQRATDNFSKKLGQGGFGSVYEGVLKDGTRLAVKQLEGIGQGKKEFRAEVSIIGGIHHHHLVRLKGFCTEGLHRLLVYEYMANGSLDRWIFKKNKTEFLLDWDTRYNIAVGTAKGLAYLHEDCDVKIVHCDIKPENVLLDDNFRAKVSDFGLAKLMTREQSHVFTTMRGTRGYLAPEWITSYAISEKSDVYSFGMVLLEIIGGRKNYDSSMISEKSHFPSYAFKMMEEGNTEEIIDAQMKIDERDERVIAAIKVALWCIQDDMNLRPPMTKVVQMLEGLCPVPAPPMASQTGSRLYSGLFKSVSEEGTSSGPSDCNSDTYFSAIRLSGPRYFVYMTYVFVKFCCDALYVAIRFGEFLC
ncbi:G-type lectin S-receptor-like serine/threonine-protein kinase SD2-5 [Bidens hawaiensis]|uniref:G-type lectin S-receptor-like serine/threonine-protein kinase SD2-5 n=1 Tax=Bidens hawaiensis TaxID=980011 RepID=UPI00404AAEB0